jgi:hypothetical protein
LTSVATHRHHPRVPLREEGRFGRSSRNAGRDAVDAAVPGAFMRPTIGMRRGRRSRVVLTPQGRRQVSHHDVRGDGDNKARSPGRARRKPLKPSAQGRPAFSGEPVVTNSCACFHRTRGCGCIGHPAFPAPSLFLRDTQDASLGRFCAPGTFTLVSPPSSPAKAGDPVRRDVRFKQRRIWNAGSPGRAGRRQQKLAV